MSDSITLPRALRTRLQKAAERAHASPETLVHQAVLAHLDYLEWRERSIEEGFASGKTEGWRSTEEVFAAVSAQRAGRARKRAS